MKTLPTFNKIPAAILHDIRTTLIGNMTVEMKLYFIHGALQSRYKYMRAHPNPLTKNMVDIMAASFEILDHTIDYFKFHNKVTKDQLQYINDMYESFYDNNVTTIREDFEEFYK